MKIRGSVQFTDEPGPVPGTGWADGFEAGADWAQANAPGALVLGFPAVENVQMTGFPSDAYAKGYWSGVWGTWCPTHAAGDCLATWVCVRAVRALAKEQQEEAA